MLLQAKDTSTSSQPTSVEAMQWDRFTDFFKAKWKRGQHIALLGPTGTGKTTLACGILPMRKYVMALDPKGGDSTLEKLKRKGFIRCETWPIPREGRKRIEEGKPLRLIMGPQIVKRADIPRQRGVLQAALDGAFDEGNWTVYVDELQVLADRRMLQLGSSIERNMIAARDRGVSMVTSFQRPAHVPRAAADQATWLFLWHTRDVDSVNRIAEMAGRPKPEIRGAIGALQKHNALVISRDPSQPLIIVRPPMVG